MALIGFACRISAPLDLVHLGAWMWYTPINLDCELWVFHSLKSLSSTRKVDARTSANQLVHQRVGYSTITTLVLRIVPLDVWDTADCFTKPYLGVQKTGQSPTRGFCTNKWPFPNSDPPMIPVLCCGDKTWFLLLKSTQESAVVDVSRQDQ